MIRRFDGTHLVFYKPFQVLTQFRDGQGRRTLADYIPVPNVYAAGRLDYDSEGLLLLTSNGILQQRLTDPRFAHPKTYWAQVEGEITDAAIAQLKAGVPIQDYVTRRCEARRMETPSLDARVPPIRYRHDIPTSWVELVLREGRNRQVRRMTAAVGFATLRLVRAAIGEITLAGLGVGAWRELTLLEQASLAAEARGSDKRSSSLGALPRR